MENIQEKIRKLRKILQPDSGSSENEKTIAATILKKYEDLGHDTDIWVERRYEELYSCKNEKQKDFLFQILANVLGDDGNDITIWTVRNHKWNRVLEMNESQHIEVREKYEFYWRDYQKQLEAQKELFYSAYVQKNSLWSTRTPSNKSDPTSPEELDRLRMMFDLVDTAEFSKRLNPGN